MADTMLRVDKLKILRIVSFSYFCTKDYSARLHRQLTRLTINPTVAAKSIPSSFKPVR